MTITTESTNTLQPGFKITNGCDVAEVSRGGLYVELRVSASDGDESNSQLFDSDAAREIAFALLLAADRCHVSTGLDGTVTINDSDNRVQYSSLEGDRDFNRKMAVEFLATAIGINNLKAMSIDTTDHEAELITAVKGLDTNDLKRVREFVTTL